MSEGITADFCPLVKGDCRRTKCMWWVALTHKDDKGEQVKGPEACAMWHVGVCLPDLRGVAVNWFLAKPERSIAEQQLQIQKEFLEWMKKQGGEGDEWKEGE